VSIEVDGRPAAVGRAGDQPLVTDADCDGDDDLLVFRPGTGEVFDFELDGLTTGQRAGRLVHRDPDTIELLAAAPCGSPAARRRDGTSTPVVTP
jgi:hypothetical protein